NVGEHPDPNAAGALHATRERPAGGLDLAGGQALGLGGLEAERAEIQRVAACRLAVNAALEGLPVLRFLRLQHVSLPQTHACAPSRSRRGRCDPSCGSAMRLSCAIGSCSRISPLNTQTFTPLVP